MKPTVFIHTNDKQMLGALVSLHSMKRNSAHPEAFDVSILATKDHPFLLERQGQTYRRGGKARVWRNEDLQSFTPLRFMPPQAMGYSGRAVVVDPDVFAVGDVWELLSRNMQGAAIMCRGHWNTSGKMGRYASSVMLLDCAKLTHWRCEEQFNALFEDGQDYSKWMGLELEPADTIGLLEPEWNDFDQLTPATKLLHNTHQYTQPWKTGLALDFMPVGRPKGLWKRRWLNRIRKQLFGEYGLLGHYRPHPDRNQERFFFGLLRECLDNGLVTEQMIQREIQAKHVRRDAFQVLEALKPSTAPQ